MQRAGWLGMTVEAKILLSTARGFARYSTWTSKQAGVVIAQGKSKE
jgi:hypothetical protein